MKRLILPAIAALTVLTAAAVEKSSTIVYINGTKYYIHRVLPKETLYGLSKCYEVSEQTILDHNPAVKSEGLKIDQNIKIPVTAAAAPEQTPAQLPERKLRKQFDRHEVQAGETLFAISRKYAISLQVIMEDNPGIDPSQLHPGQTVLIRKKAAGDQSEADSQAEWENYRETLNSVSDNGTAYHLVHIGETFYSISRRFGVTEAELSAMNDGMKPEELKLGALIKVPGMPGQPGGEGGPAAEEVQPQQPEGSDVEFRACRPFEPLTVALLLPLATGAAPNANYLEFYQGFLLALEEVKAAGRTVRLELFNTAHSPARMEEIMEEQAFRDAGLIVGPIYEDVMAPVVRYAEEHAIPVVSPLAQIGHLNSDVLFQLSPATEYKYDKMEALLHDGARVTLIRTEHTDREFEAEIMALLGNTPRHEFQYRYRHPSEGAQTSDLTALLQHDGPQIFVVLADNEVEVDRILAAIASADTGIVSRGQRAPQFTVIGNPRWNRYANIDRTVFFKDRVTMISNYHARRDAENVRAFDSRYIKAFGTMPTLYAYRGYDVARLFVPAMYDDIQYDMEGRTYMPLQTPYRFGQSDGRRTHINREWVRISYHPDFTVTTE